MSLNADLVVAAAIGRISRILDMLRPELRAVVLRRLCETQLGMGL